MKIAKEISGIILAGGKSSRMGTSKAELEWKGGTLVRCQAEKLRKIGITDIIIAGYSGYVENSRYVPDIYAGKGPLSGIHSGLLVAENETCFVMGVDIPLLSEQIIIDMINEHIRSSN